MQNFKVQGNIVDITNHNIFFGEVTVNNNKIQSISAIHHLPSADFPFILPGFIDSHVHVESSMLVPSEFAKLAVVHGTVSTISDPHEIANVCGMQGVEFMIENGKTVPFKFNFGAPSCVPATIYETAGAALDSSDVKLLLERLEIKYLSEMMNFPGVLQKDEEVMKKIAAAHALGKPVDGHAPGLRGDAAQQYIDAGIYTDHECFTAAEALDKLQRGMKILIREGSAAKNFEALIGLMNDWPNMMMFCSDDKHPDSLVAGHINQLCARAVAKGIDVFNVLKAACINPILHYKLDVGQLQVGDPADFIIAENLVDFKILKTYINGELVAEDGKSLIINKIPSNEGWTAYPPNYIHPKRTDVVNNFNCSLKAALDFEVLFNDENKIPVIEALDGQLITNKLFFTPKVVDGKIVSDVENDVLKIVVINRYREAPIAKGWIKNFGLKHGAIASSVAHDSHNIITVGVDDENIAMAVNLLIGHHGGISVIRNCPVPKELHLRYSDIDIDQQKSYFEDYFTGGQSLPLPVAGLMSDIDGYKVAENYTAIDKIAKQLGSNLAAPFMTLSFMALLVIPHLKLSDKGLFDGDGFTFI